MALDALCRATVSTTARLPEVNDADICGGLHTQQVAGGGLSKQPAALKKIRMVVTQTIEEAVKQFRVPDTSADVPALCTAAASAAAAGES
jgi:hypothetical protein